MRINKSFSGRTKAVVAGAAVLAVAGVAGAGTSIAAGQITSAQIKNGTIQTRDLTKNNFARFTATEQVVTGATPVSTNPAYGGQRVTDITGPNTPLATVVLNKGTWKLQGEAQFWHITGPGATAGADLGEVTINGLSTGYANNFTGDVPDGGVNPAQTSFSGTITITANDTPVTVYGSIVGNNTGQAGAQITATQYKYVKQHYNK